jgi:hypothetical protein
MALLKEIELNSGVIAKYHNVDFHKKTADGGEIDVVVNSYLNKDARDSGKRPLLTKYYPIRPTFFRDSTTENVWEDGKIIETKEIPPVYQGNGNVEDIVYAFLKTLPQFEGAENI